jgi:hypothetical protein
MSMVRLNDLLPSDQKVPDWGLNSKDDDILPSNSEYVIFESYCSNTSCRCKKVIVEIAEINQNQEVTGKPLVIIDYDWSSKKTRCYPTLHEQSPKTDIASRLLKIYKDIVHNEKYLERIKNHYTRVKELTAKRNLTKIKNEKIERNAFCPCGSGKNIKNVA